MTWNRRSTVVLFSLCALLLPVLLASTLAAQTVDQSRGVDARVDYAALQRFGPWDDRNYQLTAADIELLSPNEADLAVQIPAFFRVEMRRAWPELMRTGSAQYPRSAEQIFMQLYGGYQIEGKLYRGLKLVDGRYVPVAAEGEDHQQSAAEKFLTGEVKMTSPVGAAESAIKINPVDTNLVIAGANNLPAFRQDMYFSTDGGVNWSLSAPLPQGGTCCDPTVDWSSDGTLAYSAALGNCSASGCAVFFYRSADGGQTWTDLATVTPGDPRRELALSGADKEFLHVDHHAGSPHQDNLYMTWHQANVMRAAVSTDQGNTWNTTVFSSLNSQRGIGSDITTDKNGDVYYFWPTFVSRRIQLRKSTNGGVSYAPAQIIANTNGSFTFPVPSMETRQVFLYVSADSDLSSGTYGGSVYVAWSDSTAFTSGNPAANHSRIQVAFSRDGGATWTIVTPHETSDANSVDRYHQWLSVAADGKVHLIFYDTRRDATRSSVDIFHTVSMDGAQTFSTPQRITAQQSPNIANFFEFGDYNGLDVVMPAVFEIAIVGDGCDLGKARIVLGVHVAEPACLFELLEDRFYEHARLAVLFDKGHEPIGKHRFGHSASLPRSL